MSLNVDFVNSQNLLTNVICFLFNQKFFICFAGFFLLFSFFIKFRTRTIIFKDLAEWFMGLCLIFYPSIVYFILGDKLLTHKSVGYFIVVCWLLIFFGFVANSFIYNGWDFLKAFISIIAKTLIIIFTYYFLFSIYNYYKLGYFNGLLGYLELGGFLVLYFVFLWLFMNGKRYLDGDYKLCDVYFWLGKIFFRLSVIFSIFALLSGYGFLASLNIVLYGLFFSIFFKILLKLSIWSHIRALLVRLGENLFDYKIKIFFTDEINAFAYKVSNKKAIGVTDKLVKEFNINELNFAIAHELAHHRNSHLTVKFWTEILTTGAIGILLSLGILPGFIRFLGVGAVHLIKKRFYKEEEHEADEHAVEYLKKAGLTQKGALTFFEKLQQLDSDRSVFRKVLNLLLEDHPYPEKRLERIKKLVEY